MIMKALKSINSQISTILLQTFLIMMRLSMSWYKFSFIICLKAIQQKSLFSSFVECAIWVYFQKRVHLKQFLTSRFHLKKSIESNILSMILNMTSVKLNTKKDVFKTSSTSNCFASNIILILKKIEKFVQLNEINRTSQTYWKYLIWSQ